MVRKRPPAWRRAKRSGTRCVHNPPKQERILESERECQKNGVQSPCRVTSYDDTDLATKILKIPLTTTSPVCLTTCIMQVTTPPSAFLS